MNLGLQLCFYYWQLELYQDKVIANGECSNWKTYDQSNAKNGNIPDTESCPDRLVLFIHDGDADFIIFELLT